jgi:N-acetylneuraminate synthase
MEFTEQQWLGLKCHAEEKGLEFLSSPFSVDAARMLSRIGVSSWKVASGEISNPQLFEYMIQSRLPIVLSSGMSSVEETDAAVDRIQKAGIPCAVAQCTSKYPCPPEQIGLNMIPYYRQRYHCAVGLSDHSGTMFPALAAVTMGVDLVEVHVTFSRDCFGPDVSSSLTTEEFKTMIEGIRFIETMKANDVDKKEIATEMAPLRHIFTKSIVAERDLPRGTLLTADCLSLKKPGTGIPASKLPLVIGRRIERSIVAGQMLSAADLGEDFMRVEAET